MYIDTTDLAPIAIFAYNRPEHLRRTVESLLTNPQATHSHVFFFSDGPRHAQARDAVAAVRHYLRSVTGFRQITIVEREHNLGLANSIIQGVTQICGLHDKVIVLEDDLLVSPYFLQYMNDGLRMYAGHDAVISIHAYTFPVEPPLPETFFLRGAGCLGWATWLRAWQLFEPDARKLLKQLRERGLQKTFDYDGSYPYSRMLQEQFLGRNNSWAIRWHASAFLLDKMTLHPRSPLVIHIGNDGSGTHYGIDDFMGDHITNVPINVNLIPLELDRRVYAKYVRYFKAHHGSGIRTLSAKMRNILRQLMPLK